MLALNCFAEGRDGHWLAICPELDISVQGKSFEDAKSRLEGAVGVYLERLSELSPEERAPLLSRRVPFHVALQIMVKVAVFGVLLPLLRRRKENRTTPHSYNFPLNCHA